MALVTGPELDSVVKQLISWYLQTRDELVRAMEQGYPYGSSPLNPQEQVQRFMRMSTEDWQTLIARLGERHKGKPNIQELVRADLQGYITRMSKLAYRR